MSEREPSLLISEGLVEDNDAPETIELATSTLQEVRPRRARDDIEVGQLNRGFNDGVERLSPLAGTNPSSRGSAGATSSCSNGGGRMKNGAHNLLSA